MATNNNTQQASIGQAFGILMGTIVSIILFIPRLIGLADKVVDIADDIADSGKALTTTMRESAEDFRNTSKLESDARYKQRQDAINQVRTNAGLQAVEVQSARTLSPEAQAKLDALNA